MVDFDLRELSAPLEALRPEVNAAYKRLDEKWNAVSEQLSKLPIPCNVGFTIYENLHCPADCLRLEWRKWKGKKRICIVSYDGDPEEDGTVTPYDEWSGEQRATMLHHVPQLFDAAVKRTQAFIARTQE